MPVPSSIDDLSTTPGSNSPSGSETPTEGDNYLRTLSAFIAQLRDRLISGTYTPTGFAGLNVSVVTPQTAQYIRIGNIVTVSGTVGAVPTLANTSSKFTLSLPFSSNLAFSQQAAGSGATLASDPKACHVYGDTSLDRVQFSFSPATASAQSIAYTYTYQVL
jgi:hypothetical protein